MAAAEARAVWQRAVNRCFVQEDAKRAPKLACCQSSAASTKQADSGSSGVTDLPDHSAASFMPLSRGNPQFPNCSPDMRWWAQMQPSGIYHKGLNNNQMVNTSEADMKTQSEGSVNPPAKYDKNHLYPESERNVMGKKQSSKVVETDFMDVGCENVQEFLELMETKENYDFGATVHEGFPVSKKTNEPESLWMSSEKSEPWWRTTDKYELASLVAQRSLYYIENCDLPTPQKLHTSKYPCGNTRRFNCDELSSLDRKSQARDSPTILGRKRASTEDGLMQHGSEKSFSNSANHTGEIEMQPPVSENGLSKAQLLEALRHSQTRAREAEEATKEVYAEKEHLVKLLFKQASQLFAYKQWFQLLQLEALYLRIKKNNDPPIPTLFPADLPCKGRKPRRSFQKGRKGKRERSKPDVTSYAVAFALGLSLVGAGLLLGWTVGWMFPF